MMDRRNQGNTRYGNDLGDCNPGGIASHARGSGRGLQEALEPQGPRWPESSDHRRTVITSKRIEKREELLLLCLGQIEEALRHVLGLGLVALDRALQRYRFEIMHKARPHAQAPKWSRAEF